MYDDATLEKLRSIDANKTAEGEALRSSLSKKLKSEIVAGTSGMIADAHKNAERDVAALGVQAAKHRRAVEEDLLRMALDPTLLDL